MQVIKEMYSVITEDRLEGELPDEVDMVRGLEAVGGGSGLLSIIVPSSNKCVKRDIESLYLFKCSW